MKQAGFCKWMVGCVGLIGLGVNLFAAGSGAGSNSFISGYQVQATGANSAAFGQESVASGWNAIAAGYQTQSMGSDAVAFGDKTQAKGNNCAAFGWKSMAMADQSFAAGASAVANGQAAAAFGDSTQANNEQAAAFGYKSQANGRQSFAMGSNTRATSYVSIAMGRNNVGLVSSGGTTGWVDNDSLLELGNGSGAIFSNAVTVFKNANFRSAGTIEAKNGMRVPPQGDLSMGEFTAGKNPADLNPQTGLKYQNE